MTTRQGSAHLHPDTMKTAFISTCRHMFPKDNPLMARVRDKKFNASLPAMTFADKGMLVDGMGRFLFQVMEAEADGEAAAKSIIRKHMAMDPVAVATSLVAILLNARNELPFFAAIGAAERILGKTAFAAKMNGRMRASLEFLKACEEDGAKYPEVIIIGSELVKAREDIIEAAAMLGRGSAAGYDGRSLFRGVFAISGVVFEDEDSLHGAMRTRLLDDYVKACTLLFMECPYALDPLSAYFSIAVEDRLNGEGGKTVIRMFTDGDAIRRMLEASQDNSRFDRVIKEIMGLDKDAKKEPAILLS